MALNRKRASSKPAHGIVAQSWEDISSTWNSFTQEFNARTAAVAPRVRIATASCQPMTLVLAISPYTDGNGIVRSSRAFPGFLVDIKGTPEEVVLFLPLETLPETPVLADVIWVLPTEQVLECLPRS